VRAEPRGGGVVVSADSLAGLSDEELAVVWPTIAARAGLRMDWRGTQRAAGFTRSGRVGSRIQLSGGWEVARLRDAFELQPAVHVPTGEVPLHDGLAFDVWSFALVRVARHGADAWAAVLPAGVPLTVRRWRPGDRLRAGADGPRRVKRFLADARVGGALRARWPVVLAGGEIVWIPGIRRGHAAATRPGQPGVLFRCELNDR